VEQGGKQLCSDVRLHVAGNWGKLGSILERKRGRVLNLGPVNTPQNTRVGLVFFMHFFCFSTGAGNFKL
jgi:hypothetical protein